MEKIFLDVNSFIDVMEGREPNLKEMLGGHQLYISVNTIGIWTYIYKVEVQQLDFFRLRNQFNLVEHTLTVTERACSGPTKDYEDNVQLHSAIKAECTLFLTNDKELLELGYFGGVKVLSPKKLKESL